MTIEWNADNNCEFQRWILLKAYVGEGGRTNTICIFCAELCSGLDTEPQSISTRDILCNVFYLCRFVVCVYLLKRKKEKDME